MGIRPTPNPRRGFLRAAATVVLLTALLIVGILVVSSLSAPSAKAPTNPPTPGPITPLTVPTAATPGAVPASRTPRAIPSPTHKKKTLGSILRARPSLIALERAAPRSLLMRAAAQVASVAIRSHHHLVWFASSSNRPVVRPLLIRSLPHGVTRSIGPADSLVKPVWSTDGRFVLYVVPSSLRSPFAVAWTLRQYDSQTGLATQLATSPGIAMVPLGWWHGEALFLVATSTDTSIYTARGGRAHFVAVLAPQIITSAALSPLGSQVAFIAPTNCYNCTVEVFDLRTLTEWNGPSGITDESQLAWSRDGQNVITLLHRRIGVIHAATGGRVRLTHVVRMPKLWQHSLQVSVLPAGVRVYDTARERTEFSAFDGRRA